MIEEKLEIFSRKFLFKALLGVLFFLIFSESAFSESNSRKTKDSRLLDLAQKAAEMEFRKFSSDRIIKFSCHLSKEDKKNWYFVCKDLDDAPPPGSDSMVTVSKMSRKAIVTPGR